MDVQYVVDENIRFAGKVTQISNFRYVQVVIGNYNEEQLNEFRNSCFSYLEELNNRRMRFSGKLVHEFLFNMVRTNKGNEAWFKIDNQLVRFGLQEYCLISGLLSHNNCETMSTYSALGKSRLRRRYFNNSSQISLNGLEYAFINCENQNDKYKLGLALLIEGFFKPMERKKINVQTLSLVDNLEVCYEYPWGRHSFFILLRSLMKSWERLAARAMNGDSVPYSIYGCPTVFQLWIYEACPQIGEKFGVKLENKFPRILSWDIPQKIERSDVCEFLNCTQIVAVPILLPTEEELEQSYVYTMVLVDDTADIRFDAIVDQFEYEGQHFDEVQEEVDEEERNEGNIGPEPPAEPELDENFDKSWSPYISNEYDLPNDDDDWPPTNVTYMDHYNEEQNIPDYAGPSTSGYDYSEHDYVTYEKLNSLFDQQRTYFDNRLDEQTSYIDNTRDELLLRLDELQPNNDVKELQQYIDKKFDSFRGEQSSLFGGLRDEFQSSFGEIQRMFEGMNVQKPGAGVGNEIERTDGGETSTDEDVFIPILCDIDKKIESDFASWSHRAKTRDVIRLHGGYTLTKEKLLNLGNPEFPLEAEDMDAALMLIRARSRNFEDIFSDKYAVLDSGFGSLMIQVRIKSLDPRGQFLQHAASSSSSSSSSLYNSVMGYVNGYLPKNFGKKWKECNYLLWPYLVDNKYWVLFHVDLKKWKLTLFHNYQQSTDDASIYISVLPIVRGLPDVIQRYAPELGTNKNEPLEYWRKPITDIPQLQRYSDSGIFVMKYVECLVAGITLDAVRVDKIPIYRYKMMLDFFNKQFFFIPYERNREQS